ncbi:unnamed protein product [Miscanthus lutarioriparius]|uniref:Uncharacterized protein n=1 Tax=Miscanthus lutarioriparius TaxID=422564 RepID=A0A811N9U5_9POAL|nr:unnamed protein product [Miscanthus lutarioriparius]
MWCKWRSAFGEETAKSSRCCSSDPLLSNGTPSPPPPATSPTGKVNPLQPARRGLGWDPAPGLLPTATTGGAGRRRRRRRLHLAPLNPRPRSTSSSRPPTPWTPAGAGRTKATRWVEESDISIYDTDTDADDDAESAQPSRGSYLDAVRRGSPAQASLEAGTSSQQYTCVVKEQPPKAAEAGELQRPSKRKRGKRRPRPRQPVRHDEQAPKHRLCATTSRLRSIGCAQKGEAPTEA